MGGTVASYDIASHSFEVLKKFRLQVTAVMILYLQPLVVISMISYTVTGT